MGLETNKMEVNNVICPKCNNENSDKAMYCMYCANKIGRSYNVKDNMEGKEGITATNIKTKTKSKKAKNPNQAVNIKVSEELKYDLESFKTLRNIKFDYAAIGYLLQSWAKHIDPSERALYDQLRMR